MLSSPIQLYRKHFSYIASLYSKRKKATMVENTHTEDEKIREDSNEGLDSGSSNVVVAVAFAFVAAFVAVAAAAALCLRRRSYCYTATETAALLPKWRRQHNFERRRPGFSRCLLPLGMI